MVAVVVDVTAVGEVVDGDRVVDVVAAPLMELAVIEVVVVRVVADGVGSTRTTVVVAVGEGPEGAGGTTVAGNTAVPMVVAVPLAGAAVGTPDDGPEPALTAAGRTEVGEPSGATDKATVTVDAAPPGVVVVATPDNAAARADVVSVPAPA